ncbi:LysR family transcriptional regulator [Corynebacterium flavescens]|uniref:LysR family transcriptional regulator n=1 Tax=Corynebacterium flavescens TaxID=28028 RepID=UPI00264A08E1|nr:LysR family transcriptional regulator [Corynebacterium flavescens]MDN6199947.1 LysR family transcriptional regulator [Corynebacterium flavescens]MDN6227211.1 LysR family transcriptional regulator [Corynebacterium flavescens]MDN6235527.1 LysR family transcriptional regulator [Corynebacterium flavescens]MDN6431563.1 LysR family transcriptional regulator [Corynebacterium flavescens]MDN6475721.1 LysR family transcriptional regulator [Corynebacterium flavescens]
MNLEDVRGVVAVAQVGLVGAAADELGISQSALTRRVQRIEKDLGATLFERSGRRLVPNSRGQAFLEPAKAMLAAQQRARDAVSRLMDPELGTVRLDFMHSLGTWMVPDLLKSYRELHPRVDIRLHQGAARELQERVVAGESDIALVGPRPVDADSALGWHQIKLQRLGLAVPDGHWAAGQAKARLANFAEEAFIGMLPGYGTRMLLDGLSTSAGFNPKLVFESMELTTVAGLVSAGLGCALLPLDDPYLQVDNLIPLDPPAYRELGLIWRKADDAPPVRQLRDAIIGGFVS